MGLISRHFLLIKLIQRISSNFFIDWMYEQVSRWVNNFKDDYRYGGIEHAKSMRQAGPENIEKRAKSLLSVNRVRMAHFNVSESKNFWLHFSTPRNRPSALRPWKIEEKGSGGYGIRMSLTVCCIITMHPATNVCTSVSFWRSTIS